eukprot:CAMPEP_0171175998 /NCGR_PEP_ID=MMETSP0790-20130122/11513_1 /TAXON_ID=2925 /ORGANISM="Alexandrium catenella, Strain OF101" /LENGTH=837 /DNA_ID=CAMNT_0011640883 /DNA_START=69 /DNA_END=2579 /DNA_ORIENTATION=+
MAPKRKSAKAAAAEPAAKEAKTEVPKKKEEKEPEPKEEPAAAAEAAPEEPKEKEQDDKKDARATIKEPVCFHGAETTLNVVPTNGGNLLMALTDGGMQFLIAGARANVGVKSGRYFFEAKVVEAVTPMEGWNQGKSRAPMPRQLVRLGFSVANSSLILADGGENCVCFDSEGYFYADKKRTPSSQRFARDQALGVLLNLDAKSPNANTVSLFCNGQRVSEPQPLPEKLRGQVLFPHVSYRNVSLHVNFGAEPLSALPFKCRMLQEAAAADVKEVKAEKPKDGKYEVLFPVAFPDEGTFDWLDGFMEKHPSYTELSDRKIQEWAVKSGAWKPKSTSWRNSNDKPEYNFGLQFMDDFSIRRCLSSIAAVVPRNYVVMEVKQNLTPADRKSNLKRFAAPHFKKVAHVVMGEPPKDYKEKVHTKLLEDKQAKAEAAWKMRQLERERKKAIAQRQKEIAEQQRALAAKRKEAEEEAKKEEDAKMKDAGEEAGEGEKAEEGDGKKEGESAPEKEGKGEEAKEEEKAAEETKGEEKKEEGAAEEAKEEEDADEPMPQVELTEEEKSSNFKPAVSHDIALHSLNSIFSDFCIPEKDEGFDDVKYEWQTEADSKAYLKKWVLEKKVTSRIEDLAPGEAFKTKLEEFKKTVSEWQAKHKEFTAKKQAADAEKKKAAEGEEKKDGEEELEEKMDVDIMSVEDVCDVGNGEPLFAEFAFEDWALLTLRFELHLLQEAFREDANDPERVGIHESHLLFYYDKYYKKQLTPGLYGKDTPADVVDLVKDAVQLDSESRVLASALEDGSAGLATLAKLQEESRRKRQQRIDAGDETARLNFALLQTQESNPQG